MSAEHAGQFAAADGQMPAHGHGRDTEQRCDGRNRQCLEFVHHDNGSALMTFPF